MRECEFSYWEIRTYRNIPGRLAVRVTNLVMGVSASVVKLGMSADERDVFVLVVTHLFSWVTSLGDNVSIWFSVYRFYRWNAGVSYLLFVQTTVCRVFLRLDC